MRRSESVSDYFEGFLKHWRDSVRRNSFHIGLDDTYREEAPAEIRMLSRNNPENWTMLDALVREDGILSRKEKEEYAQTASVLEPDLREQRLQRLPSYRHIRESLYPRLRTVRFDFHLHRKGLQKDTIHTTVVDTAYMRGLQAIRNREYEQAVTLLRPYKDYNTAVAFCALDYNASALEVLEPMERTDKVLGRRELPEGLPAQSFLRAPREPGSGDRRPHPPVRPGPGTGRKRQQFDIQTLTFYFIP